jgi:hypothetical protein
MTRDEQFFYDKTMTITLKRAATCAQCGAALPVGARASWYRNGAVYGLTCHARDWKRGGIPARAGEPLGLTRSRYDKGGLYTPDGRCIARVSCGCEDYPCCGH